VTAVDARERELLDRIARAAGRVKLFPLPEVALFPTHGLPLHVFEPRYRELTRDALSGDRVLALPRLRFSRPTPGDDDALFPICGVGVITEHRELSDGRFHVVVRGLARARVVREHPLSRPYREAEIEVLREEAGEGDAEAAGALGSCLLELGKRLSGETQLALGRLAALHRDPGRLADLSAAALLIPPSHQAVLDELNIGRRLRLVTEQVAELLLSSERGDPSLRN
jgi:Lon protease-like protein